MSKAAQARIDKLHEAEQGILGSILLGHVDLDTANRAIGPGDFRHIHHQNIFAGMQIMKSSGEPDIDEVTLIVWLEHNGKLEAAGGIAYISSLADRNLPRSKAFFDRYVELVKDQSTRRATVLAAKALKNAALEPDADLDDLKVRAEHLAGSIGAVGQPREIVGPNGMKLPDMPESVLDGRLGEICQTRLKDFPVAFSWLAVLAAAGAVVRPGMSPLRSNLYVALVGPIHCGKSSAIDRANHLTDVKPPILEKLKAGSAEGMLARVGDQKGDAVLLCPDELTHLLEKAQITNASFAYILNSLFYSDTERLTIAHGKKVDFNCRLSLIGGIVDQKFDDSFGSATVAGLYDRFLFGQCPSDYEYMWRPIEGKPAFDDQIDEVTIRPDVWPARDAIAKSEGINPRLLEISIRCAGICAAVDRRGELQASDLEPAWELARYQTRVRLLLQPNPGKNYEARVALKILNHLNRHAPEGSYMVLRDVLRATHAYDFGPSTAENALKAMKFGGAVEEADDVVKGQKRRLIRLAGDCQ